MFLVDITFTFTIVFKLGFPMSASFYQCSLLIIYMLLLPEGQTDEV